MKRVLLTVSGVIPPDLADQVERGARPRADYVLMCDAFDADLLDVASARESTGRLGAILERIGGPGLLIAWVGFRRRGDYRVVVSDGEQVGIPFAAMCRFLGRKGVRHMMIVHMLSVPKKAWLMRTLRLVPMVDCFVVYCSAQRDFVVGKLRARDDDVVLTPFMVDTAFFDPESIDVPRRRMICAAGLERRDYPTLMEAVDGLDVDVVVAAASPWSKQDDSSSGRPLPSNMTIVRLDFAALRRLYAESAFVVVPLVEIDFQAGITTILEAMSMGRCAVCTLTTGQNDTIVDDRTGRYVPPGDAAALRSAIEALLAQPGEADRLGAAARQWAVEHARIDLYAERLAQRVAMLASSGPERG